MLETTINCCVCAIARHSLRTPDTSMYFIYDSRLRVKMPPKDQCRNLRALAVVFTYLVIRKNVCDASNTSKTYCDATIHGCFAAIKVISSILWNLYSLRLTTHTSEYCKTDLAISVKIQLKIAFVPSRQILTPAARLDQRSKNITACGCL